MLRWITSVSIWNADAVSFRYEVRSTIPLVDGCPLPAGSEFDVNSRVVDIAAKQEGTLPRRPLRLVAQDAGFSVQKQQFDSARGYLAQITQRHAG